MARIALDAMGGDFAPQATVAGALLALRELDSKHAIQLVGRTAVITETLDTLLRSPEYAPLAAQRDRVTIVEAPDVIEMADKPGAAIRGKPNSSMIVGLKLQADGKSDAFVSAGNTGAQMAASMIVLRLHPGVKRPGIVTIFPTAKKQVVFLDSGANVDCSADELVTFARLGSVFAEDMLGRTNPAVGLLSIGEEAEKGNAVTKEAHQLLQKAGLNFIGNVEGRDLPKGASDAGDLDVVVCDGFVGNVVLKFYEATGPFIIGLLAKAGLDPQTMMGALKDLDYSEHGGAPLLGVNGISIISHGKSSPRAIKNAIKVAIQAIDSQMNDHIGGRMSDAAGGTSGNGASA